MTTDELIAVLRANLGQILTDEIAADICTAADSLSRLVTDEQKAAVLPEEYGEFTYAIERIENIAEEIKPLHRAHWDETEGHRADLPFNPDYGTFLRYERAGRYVLFTMRVNDELLGNCAMYLSKSAHTQTLIATEDTLYLLPQARRGRNAFKFVAYVERALQTFGAREIDITVKTVNAAGRFFCMLGYRHVENGLTKILEDESCAPKHQSQIH